MSFLGSMINDSDTFLPVVIRRAFTGSFLFIGYRLQDTNFLLLLNTVSGSHDYPSILVELPPSFDENKREKAIMYFEKYQGHKIGGSLRIYWGTGQQFVLELRSRVTKFKEEFGSNKRLFP